VSILDQIGVSLGRAITQLAGIDTDFILLTMLLVISPIILDRAQSVARRKRADTGLIDTGPTISIDGSKTLPVRNYISEMQGLAGRPDALISENGFLIPIERKPLARRVRDRYVAQLLVYMRLIEEFEGKKPPYGYLILGPKARRFKIENTPERQAWLQKMLDEMREILAGAPAKPEPHPRKCRKCDVRGTCTFRAEESPQLVTVNSRAEA